MKKLISLILCLSFLFTLTAQAETVIDRDEKRGIKLHKVTLNETEEGVSPTTGLYLEDYDIPDGFYGLAANGRYLPMLVQIDNTNGGVDNIAPWGASYADLVYETPLHSNGSTRISFLFSDLIPTSVGPVRSARIGHCYLREEWDAGFLYYGGQTRTGSNIEDVFREYGANKKGVLFSGTVGAGKPWKQYYTRRAGVASPHNVDANVAAMSELIPKEHTAPNHAFIFTDDLPEGDEAYEVIVNWSHEGYGSNLIYDEENNVYFRYMRSAKDELIPYEDRDSMEQLAFANVIVQFTEVKFNGSAAAPVTAHLGQGNADFFMGGVHIAGYWKREKASDRTVFYGPDGYEQPMQRGKTLIIIFPENNKHYSKEMTSLGVSYQ